MKKAKLLIAAMFMAVTLGLPAKAVFAAAISLTQADLTEACATPGTETAKGVYCDTAQHFYSLKNGDYTLSGDLTLPDEYFITLDKTGDYNLDLNNHKITGNIPSAIVSIENVGKTTTIGNGGIFNESTMGGSAVSVRGAKATLNNLVLSANGTALSSIADGEIVADITLDTVATNSAIQMNGGKLTINSGSYVASGMGAAAYLSNVDAAIHGGIFSADGASAMYYMGSEDSALVITDGTFTSLGDNGIEFEGGNLSISGGSFTGKVAGLNLSAYSGVILSGGTFKYTDTTDEGFGAISIFGEDDTSKFTSFLADGYKYSDGTAAKKSYYSMDYIALTSHTDSVISSTKPVPDGDSTDEDTSKGSSSISAPDSGRNTKETSATTSVLATLLASSAILGGVYAGKKALAKKA